MNITNWTKKQIKIALMERDVTQQDIADACGRKPCTVSRVISGHFPSEAVHQAIADALGRDVKEIWPEYYLKRAVNP